MLFFKPHFLRQICLIALLVLPAGQVFADGKMYIPDEEVSTTIPYQRAAILFNDGKQTLVLQSQYRIPGQTGDSSLAWIVPIPSVPEIASMDASMADYYFDNLDRYSRPKVIRVGDIVANILFCVWLISLILTPILKLSVRSIPEVHKPLFKWLRTGVHLYAAIGLAFILFSLFSGVGAWKGGGTTGVEVIKSEKAGIHEVKVIRADDSGRLIEWLNEHGFHHGPEDKKAFNDYIKRGWCFAVSRVAANFRASNYEHVDEGLIAPLMLRFPVEYPVYPTALTATGGHDTEILIYLASQVPLANDSPLNLKFHGHQGYNCKSGWMTEPMEFAFEGTHEFKYLSKYKAKVSAIDMAKDFEFPPGPEMPAYRDNIYVP